MRIPLGNFGQSVAQPGQSARVVPGAFDNGGSGMKAAGDALMQAAAHGLEEQRLQNEALTRAKAANHVLDHEMAVDAVTADLSQQMADGHLSYDDAPAIFKQRISEIEKPTMSGIDVVTAENLDKGFKRAEWRGENTLGAAIAKARQVDFRTQTDGILDKLGKQVGLPGADPAKINAQADGLDELGKVAYGAAWGKKKQDWIDGNWDAHLNQQAMTVRDNMDGIKALEKQITEGDYADKLDSNRRNTLVAKLEGYRTSLLQRQEAAAARAQREQERRLKTAEAEFNTFQSLADKGTILSPEYIDRVTQATAGTPYQQGIKAIAGQAQEAGGIARQPIAAQQALLDKVDALIAQQGRTPELDKRRDQIQKVMNGSLSDLKSNGLRAGLERGVIREMSPLDASTPEALSASITARLTQAQTVSMWAGKSVSPLDAREAEQVSNMLGALPPKQRSEAVATISAALGPRFSGALAEQIDAQDKPLSLAFAASSERTTYERYTSELILKGATAIKDGVVMKDDKKVTGWKATIANEVDGLLLPDERLSKDTKEAAFYIAAGKAQENGGTASPSELKNAVRLALGAELIEHNGKKLPIPAGMDAGDFEKRVKSVSATDIEKQAPGGKVIAGGAEISVTDFATSLPGQELAYAGPGRYAVIVKGRPVKNAAGRPIIIGVQ